jgi:cell division protein FtsX
MKLSPVVLLRIISVSLLVLLFAALWTVQALKSRYENNLVIATQFTEQVQNQKAETIKEVVSKAFKADASWGDPTVSQVTDESKAKEANNEFFKDLQKEDWIIQFPSKKKIIIYRESTNQIIRFGDF